MSFFFCLEWQCEHFRTHIISYSLLGEGGLEEVEEWEDERRDAAPLRMLWNGGCWIPKATHLLRSAVPQRQRFPNFFRPPPRRLVLQNPTRMKVLPHMPSGAPHRANAFLRLGDPSVNQSAAEFHNLCFSAPFCFLYELTCFVNRWFELIWSRIEIRRTNSPFNFW